MDDNYLINYFWVKFKSVNCLSISNYQKWLSGAVLKNIFLENSLQIIIKASVAELIFSYF